MEVCIAMEKHSFTHFLRIRHKILSSYLKYTLALSIAYLFALSGCYNFFRNYSLKDCFHCHLSFFHSFKIWMT